MDKKRYTGVMVKCGDKLLLCKRNNLGKQNDCHKSGKKRSTRCFFKFID